MNAAEIIEEIKHLPLDEQARVAGFVRALVIERAWTPEELSRAAEQLAAEADPAQAGHLKERIAAGFYGN